MQRLSGECKAFIVRALACFMAPSEIVEAVKEQFEVEITRQQAQSFDPTKAGGERLGQPLRDLFAATREEYVGSTYNIGISHLAYRLTKLHDLLDRAEEAGNYQLCVKILEMAAKEMGGWYVRRRDVRGKADEPIARLLAMNAPIDLNEWRQKKREAREKRAA
jgi:hypothetical protein